jgi:endoglucanase
MFIDVGATSAFDVEKKLGVMPGDPVVPLSPFSAMGNPRLYMAKAWDDRIGCAEIIEVFRRLQKAKHPNVVYGVGTVQEEVGLRGAQTSVSAVKPDIGFALDVCIARDVPGAGDGSPEKLGAGAAVVVYDGSMIPNPKLRDFVVDAGRRKKTFTTRLLKRAAPTAARYICTGPGPSCRSACRPVHPQSTSIIDRKDFEAVVSLVGSRCAWTKAVAKLTK